MKTTTKMVMVWIGIIIVLSILLSILSLSTFAFEIIPNAVKEIGTGDKYIADWLSSINNRLIMVLVVNIVSFVLSLILIVSYLSSKKNSN